MNGTPRMRSSYPSTPDNVQKSAASRGSPPAGPRVTSPLREIPQAATAVASSDVPLIPVDLVDAPSQRAYAAAFYGLLLVWRFYDWWKLVEEDTESFGLFMKWIIIDGVFLYFMPKLRIPWLEWSQTTSHAAFILHAAFNGMLMFRIPVSQVFFASSGRPG